MEQRNLKFRAWDKQENRMIQPHDGDFIRWHAMSNWKDCLVVMQWTGLYDKNYNEIYEGDILTENIEVVFKSGKFITIYKNDQQGGAELSPKRCNYLEVIGNVFERRNN